MIWAQVSPSIPTADGLLALGFDQLFSIGLLVVGIIVVSRYHLKYERYTQKVIEQLHKDKDTKADDFQELSKEFIELMKEQSATNRELRRSIEFLVTKVNNSNSNQN